MHQGVMKFLQGGHRSKSVGEDEMQMFRGILTDMKSVSYLNIEHFIFDIERELNSAHEFVGGPVA